jgi:hypothetical protein
MVRYRILHAAPPPPLFLPRFISGLSRFSQRLGISLLFPNTRPSFATYPLDQLSFHFLWLWCETANSQSIQKWWEYLWKFDESGPFDGRGYDYPLAIWWWDDRNQHDIVWCSQTGGYQGPRETWCVIVRKPADFWQLTKLRPKTRCHRLLSLDDLP